MASALQMAWQAFQKGERQQAQAIVVDFLRTQPEHSAAWLLLGTILTDPVQRRDCFERVLRLDPTNEHAKTELASLHPTTLEPTPNPINEPIQPISVVQPLQPVAQPIPRAAEPLEVLFPPGYLPTPDDLNNLASRGTLPTPVTSTPAPPKLSGGWIAALGLGVVLVLVGCVLIFQIVLN